MSIAIRAVDLGKKYQIGKKLDNSLRSSMTRMFAKNSKSDDFWALNQVNFEIQQGDVVGIIGRNGAGKSTLLKLLSQITAPSTGKIELYGRVASLLEVGTGFHPELTGRENIYLNGTILGMTRKEVAAKFDEIVAFSGIEKFIDTPVKHYSSGMYVRLGFAVAAHLEPEILVVDEVLAVGDAEFQKKCLGKMQDVAGQGRTVLFVSHSMAAVKELCKSGIYMKQGTVDFLGAIEPCIQRYLGSSSYSNIYIPEIKSHNPYMNFEKIEILNADGVNCMDFTCEDEINIQFDFSIRDKSRRHSLFVMVNDKYGSPIFGAECLIKREKMNLKLNKRFLTRGNYSITTFIHIPRIEQIDRAVDICNFSITDATSPLAIHGEYEYGNVFGNYEWTEL